MRLKDFGKTGLKVTAVGLGTWVFGGWPWNESSEKDCEAAVETALACGVGLIDTAPVYGFGRAEKIVGRVLRRLRARERVVLATKCGLSFEPGSRKVWHDASAAAVRREIEESLKRLQTERIDIYQVHWPDAATPIAETMEALVRLREEKKIRAIGVSNFSVALLEEAMRHAPVAGLQPPYNYFQRESEAQLLPFCTSAGLGTLTYGTLCKGLLTGKFGAENKPRDLVRSPKWDGVFGPDRYAKCLGEIEGLKVKAREAGLTLSQWAIRWALKNPAVTCALVGARNAKQAKENFKEDLWQPSN